MYNPSNFSNNNLILILTLDLFVIIFGIIGSLTLVACYIFVKSSRQYTFRLIVYLASFGGLYSLLNMIFDIQLLTQNQSPAECTEFGYLKQILSYMIWQIAVVIAWTFYRRSEYGNIQYDDMEKKIILILNKIDLIPR